jgi:hypothetical protein
MHMIRHDLFSSLAAVRRNLTTTPERQAFECSWTTRATRTNDGKEYRWAALVTAERGLFSV